MMRPLMRNPFSYLGRHSGAPRSGEPGIHNHDLWIWIPDSLASLGFRNDDREMR
jgi:hypothetical protein